MIPSLLSAIQNTNAVVVSGICQLYAIPKDQVTNMPDTISLLQSVDINAATISRSDITLAAGAAINAISNDNHAGTDIVEDQKASPNGPFFTYEAAFQLPNDSETRGQIARAFDNREWIVLVKESSRVWRIFGNLHRGCDFKSTLSSGSQNRGSSVNKCGFYWESSERALYMADPDFEIIMGLVADMTTTPGRITVGFTVSNASGSIGISVQLYQNNQWNTIYIGIMPNGSYVVSTPLTLPSGNYYVRVVSGGGISSNLFILTV